MPRERRRRRLVRALRSWAWLARAAGVVALLGSTACAREAECRVDSPCARQIRCIDRTRYVRGENGPCALACGSTECTGAVCVERGPFLCAPGSLCREPPPGVPLRDPTPCVDLRRPDAATRGDASAARDAAPAHDADLADGAVDPDAWPSDDVRQTSDGGT